MRGLLATSEPIEVHLNVNRVDLGAVALAWTVGPPTVAQALAVLSADPDRVRAALAGWLPASAGSDVRPLSDPNVVRLAAELLVAFTPDAGSDQDREHEAADVEESVYDVALSIGHPAGTVLTMPWPEYLGTAEATGRATRARLLEAATAARAGVNSDSEGWTAFSEGLAVARGPSGVRARKTPDQLAEEQRDADEWLAAMQTARTARGEA